jgi:hypothetical protein
VILGGVISSYASEAVSGIAICSTAAVRSSMGVRGGQADGLDEEVEERGEARVECGSGKVRLGLPMTVMGKRKSMGDSSCYYIQSRQA